MSSYQRINRKKNRNKMAEHYKEYDEMSGKTKENGYKKLSNMINTETGNRKKRKY